MANIDIILASSVKKLIDEKKYSTLREFLLTMQAADIAAAFEALPGARISLLFRLLPKELAAETFVEMDGAQQKELIDQFSDSELHDIVAELYLDDTVDIVEEMPADIVSRILAQANPETRKMINEVLKYPDDSAGSIMTTEYMELSAQMTAAEAIAQIRRTGVDKETINICYVTSQGHRLTGAVPIRELILADESSRIADIMDVKVVAVKTLDDREDAARLFSRYGYVALPVVDSENRLVGIVTVDDAIAVLNAEVAEDIDKMAAITPSDKPYLRLSAFSIYLKRIPWLLILMISATFTGAIITRYQAALSSYMVLAASIPMLMDTGGNCGSQASVTVIRGLSLHEIGFADTLTVLWKEVRVSLMCGITLAAVNYLKLVALSGVPREVAAVICITLVFTVFAAKIVGCSLPILAKRIGFDPAVMASPFITTIVDALSLFIYFNVSKILLHT